MLASLCSHTALQRTPPAYLPQDRLHPFPAVASLLHLFRRTLFVIRTVQWFFARPRSSDRLPVPWKATDTAAGLPVRQRPGRLFSCRRLPRPWPCLPAPAFISFSLRDLFIAALDRLLSFRYHHVASFVNAAAHGLSGWSGTAPPICAFTVPAPKKTNTAAHMTATDNKTALFMIISPFYELILCSCIFNGPAEMNVPHLLRIRFRPDKSHGSMFSVRPTGNYRRCQSKDSLTIPTIPYSLKIG